MKEVKLLPPKVDFVFKRIFGNEQHPNVLISFLNAVLTPIDPIIAVELRETALEREHEKDKYSRLDIKAVTNLGEIVNIEIQLKNEQNFVKRTLYYWAKLYEDQLEKGQDYAQLPKTICINLLDFNLLPKVHFHSVYHLTEDELGHRLTDVLELHFIELKKMKAVKQITDIQNKLEAWVQFINDPESEVIMELSKYEEEIREAREELKRMSGNEEERARYNKRFESLVEQVSALNYAREQEKLSIAMNFLDIADDETIATKTGLSIETVKQLRKEGYVMID